MLAVLSFCVMEEIHGCHYQSFVIITLLAFKDSQIVESDSHLSAEHNLFQDDSVHLLLIQVAHFDSNDK